MIWEGIHKVLYCCTTVRQHGTCQYCTFTTCNAFTNREVRIHKAHTSSSNGTCLCAVVYVHIYDVVTVYATSMLHGTCARWRCGKSLKEEAGRTMIPRSIPRVSSTLLNGSMMEVVEVADHLLIRHRPLHTAWSHRMAFVALGYETGCDICISIYAIYICDDTADEVLLTMNVATNVVLACRQHRGATLSSLLSQQTEVVVAGRQPCLELATETCGGIKCILFYTGGSSVVLVASSWAKLCDH